MPVETLALALFTLTRFKLLSLERRGLSLLIRRMEAVAERTGNAQLIATVSMQISGVLTHQGRYAEAEALLRALSGNRRTVGASLAWTRFRSATTVNAAYVRSLCRCARGRATELLWGAAEANARCGSSRSPILARLRQSDASHSAHALSGANDEASRSVREGLALGASWRYAGRARDRPAVRGANRVGARPRLGREPRWSVRSRPGKPPASASSWGSRGCSWPTRSRGKEKRPGL